MNLSRGDQMDNLLEKLINCFGPSGDEQNVRNLIQYEIKKYVDEIKVDKFGNLIAIKKGKGPKVMLAAHMDEIGLMVQMVAEDGHIFFQPVGGIEPYSLIGQRVALLNPSTGQMIIEGVITSQDMQEDIEITTPFKMSDLYIDTGLEQKELFKKGIEIGTYAVPINNMKFLGSKEYISGKSLDDRLGCFILVKVAEKLKNYKGNIFFVFTVQEEIGLYGAQTSIYNLDPDWAIAVDVTNAEDAYGDRIVKIGNGPCLSMMDVEMIANRCVNNNLKQLAKKHNIPLQPKVETFGTTDAAKIAIGRGGIPTTVLGVAIRNIHSPVGVAHLGDVFNVIKLLTLHCKSPPKVCLV